MFCIFSLQVTESAPEEREEEEASRAMQEATPAIVIRRADPSPARTKEELHASARWIETPPPGRTAIATIVCP